MCDGSKVVMDDSVTSCDKKYCNVAEKQIWTTKQQRPIAAEAFGQIQTLRFPLPVQKLYAL